MNRECHRRYRLLPAGSRSPAFLRGDYRATAFIFLSLLSAAIAGDIRDEAVSSRINLVQDRIFVSPDTIARQASIAYPFASSSNPASDDFLRTAPADYAGFGFLGTTEVEFNDDAWISGGILGASARLPETGTLSATAVRLDSHDVMSRQGDFFALESNTFFLRYSRKVAEYLSLGAQLRLTDSSLEIGDTFLGVPRFTHTDTLGVGITVGALLALSEEFFLGFTGGVKFDDNDTSGVVRVPGTPIPINLPDTATTTDLRLGAGKKLSDSLWIFSDLQYVHYDDFFGKIDLGRASAGLEWILRDEWALRLGGIVDTEPQAGVGAGLGYYGFDNLLVEFGYSYNQFSEVQRELGRANTFSLSAILRF